MEHEAKAREEERRERARKDRKNAAARAKRAAARKPMTVADTGTMAELAGNPMLPPVEPPTTEPVPCPFCEKLFPGVYGQPGVAMLRADNKTVICADCGTREALEGGLKMPVWRFLENYTDSHGIYLAAAIAERFLLLTGERAPWTPSSAATIRQRIAARGLGGNYDSEEPGVAGFEMAEACAWEFARFHSTRMGRGSAFRECIDALRGNGK